MNCFEPLIDRRLVRALEQHSAMAWPAPELVQINGWEVRFTPGSRSRRINCVTPMDPIADKLSETLALAKKLCTERGLACTLRINPLGGRELEDWIIAHHKSRSDDATMVQLAPLGGVSSLTSEALLSPVLTPEWLQGLTATGSSDEERALIARLLSHVTAPQAFAMVMQDGQAIAIGRAVVHQGLAGLFHIATAPDQRRQGHGHAIVSALLKWAREHNAMRAYLQVVANNQSALKLYAPFGFRDAYLYDYVRL